MKPAALLAALAALAACDETGTVSFQLAFPPGQTRLPDGTTRVRLTLDRPLEIREAPVAADGSFTLALEVPADGSLARVSLEAFDDAGTLLAVGRSAPLPISAYSDLYTLYLSPPGELAEAPVALAPARTDLGAASLFFGVLLAGGRDAAGQPSDELAVYDVYTHRLVAGAPLPSPRSGLAAFADDTDRVFLFGGAADAAGAATGSLWLFDPNLPPTTPIIEVDERPELARVGARAARLFGGRLVVTGDPPLLVDPRTGEITPLTAAPAAALAAQTATTLPGGAVALAGPGGVVVLAADGASFTTTDLPGRDGHAALRLPDGRLVLVGGADPQTGVLAVDLIGLDAEGDSFTITSPLTRPRRAPALAVTSGELVVAGGFDQSGAALDDAEILDATTLGAIQRIPLVAARGGAVAFRLTNDAVLIAGGTASAGGAPVGTLELYQPR